MSTLFIPSTTIVDYITQTPAFCCVLTQSSAKLFGGATRDCDPGAIFFNPAGFLSEELVTNPGIPAGLQNMQSMQLQHRTIETATEIVEIQQSESNSCTHKKTPVQFIQLSSNVIVLSLDSRSLYLVIW